MTSPFSPFTTPKSSPITTRKTPQIEDNNNNNPLFKVIDIVIDDNTYFGPIEIICICHKETSLKHYKHQSNLSDNMVMMDVFRMEKRVLILKDDLCKSPYFSNRLKKKWLNAKQITISAKRVNIINALHACLEYMSNNDIGLTYNSFELLAVGCILKLNQLVNKCINTIKSNLNIQNTVIAAYMANKFHLNSLMKACYVWILRNLVETNTLIKLINNSYNSNDTNTNVINNDKDNNHDNIKIKTQPILRFGKFKLPLQEFTNVSHDWFNMERYNKLNEPFINEFIGNILVERNNNNNNSKRKYKLVSNNDVNNILICGEYNEHLGEYLLTNGHHLIEWHNEYSIGYVQSNISGTEFIIYDYGIISPQSSELFFPGYNRQPLATITYKTNILGSTPRSFTMTIPLKTEGKEQLVLKNKEPVWNDALQAYTLDFDEEVRLPSKKNFILIDDDENIFLVFGKTETDKFFIKFRPPLTPLLVFGLILSSFDHKKLVT